MFRHTVFTMAMFTAFSPVNAQDQAKPPAEAPKIAPFIDDQVVAVARFDLTRIDVDALVNKAATLTATEPAVVAKSGLVAWLQGLAKGGAKDVYFIMTMKGLSNGPSLVIPIDKGVNVDAIQKLLIGAESSPTPGPVFEVCERHGDAIIAGSKLACERLKSLKQCESAELAKALAVSNTAPVVIAIVASQNTRRAIDDSLEALPKWLGGGSPKLLTRGIQWVSLSVEQKPNFTAKLVVQSPDADAAKQVNEWWTKMLGIIQADKEIAKIWPNFASLTPKLAPNIDGNRLTLTLDDATLTAGLQPAATKARAAAVQMENVNSLKQAGLALHGYHDATGAFPRAGSPEKEGKPLLSWRVHLLPYLDQEQLYKKFKLDEPWDSEHNKKLIAKMPNVYRSSAKLEPGKTTILGVVGDRAMFTDGKPVKIVDFRDGTSNTIMVVDADESQAVIWTKPDDYRYDPKNPGAGLKGRLDGYFAALFADGSVRKISGAIDAKLLNRLFDRDDGQVIGEIP